MKKTVLLLLIILIIPFKVYAEDSAGNYFQDQISENETVTGDIDRDCYIVCRDTEVRDAHVGRSFINCSYELSILNSTIGDSVRSVSESLTITDSTIDNNLTVVTRNLDISGNSSSNAIYAVAQNATIGGTTNTVRIVGDSITLSGTVTGNVDIHATNVIVETTADIQGNLNISSENEPEVKDGAKVAHLNYDQVVNEDNSTTPADMIKDTLIDILYWTAVTLILAFLIIIFARDSVFDAYLNFKEHPLALILSGIVAMILIPIISVILIFPFVTFPLTLIVSTAYVLIASICVPFTAVVIGRLVLPQMNQWFTTLIFGLIFGILSRIPYLGIILDIICLVFMLGAIILKLYENLKVIKTQAILSKPKMN